MIAQIRFIGINKRETFQAFNETSPLKISYFALVIEIQTGEILQGSLPGKQLKFVQVWAEIHREELLKNFDTLRAEKQTFNKIKPLS